MLLCIIVVQKKLISNLWRSFVIEILQCYIVTNCLQFLYPFLIDITAFSLLFHKRYFLQAKHYWIKRIFMLILLFALLQPSTLIFTLFFCHLRVCLIRQFLLWLLWVITWRIGIRAIWYLLQNLWIMSWC